MHKDLETLAGLFDELEESGDDAMIKVAVMRSEKVPVVALKRANRIFQTRERIFADFGEESENSRPRPKNSFTTSVELHDQDARDFLDASRSKKMTDTKMLVKLLFQSEATGFERAIDLAKDPAYKKRLIKGISAHFLASDWASSSGRDASNLVDHIVKENPDIDFNGVIAESFHDAVRRGRWEQAFHIHNDLLGAEGAEHLEKLSPDARQALALEYVRREKVHALEESPIHAGIGNPARRNRSSLKKLTQKKAQAIISRMRPYFEEEVQEARQTRGAIVRLVRG